MKSARLVDVKRGAGCIECSYVGAVPDNEDDQWWHPCPHCYKKPPKSTFFSFRNGNLFISMRHISSVEFMELSGGEMAKVTTASGWWANVSQPWDLKALRRWLTRLSEEVSDE